MTTNPTTAPVKYNKNEGIIATLIPNWVYNPIRVNTANKVKNQWNAPRFNWRVE
jgi:hypothetical protein